MSWNDKFFMKCGLRVRHLYKRKRGCHPVCVRCGIKRRRTTSGWEYLMHGAREIQMVSGGRGGWVSINPPCVPKRPAGARTEG